MQLKNNSKPSISPRKNYNKKKNGEKDHITLHGALF